MDLDRQLIQTVRAGAKRHRGVADRHVGFADRLDAIADDMEAAARELEAEALPDVPTIKFPGVTPPEVPRRLPRPRRSYAQQNDGYRIREGKLPVRKMVVELLDEAERTWKPPAIADELERRGERFAQDAVRDRTKNIRHALKEAEKRGQIVRLLDGSFMSTKFEPPPHLRLDANGSPGQEAMTG